MQENKAPKKKMLPASTRIDVLTHKRLLAVLKKSKYPNQGAFIRDAIVEKIEREET